MRNLSVLEKGRVYGPMTITQGLLYGMNLRLIGSGVKVYS